MVLITLLRLVHIFLGVLWAGTAFYLLLFLTPSIVAAGPAGGRVMQELVKRGQLTFFPVIGGLVVLSGLALMWWTSGHFMGGWFVTPRGIAITVGAVTALVAFLLGPLAMRPAALRAGALAGQAQAAPEGPERAALMGQAMAASARAALAGKWVAWLLAVTVVCMALSRTI